MNGQANGKQERSETMAKLSETCGCCEGTNAITPESTANRPGLSALAYRVGRHSTFLETMRANLSSASLDVTQLDQTQKTLLPLDSLKTRAASDASIALLDSWAVVADVLTFYQERIANEGFLRTATERRSVLELARLIGYALRPGVAASAFLALELDKDHEVVIQPYEIKAQSVPGPGEMPQTFENIEPLEARYGWNNLKPRLARPQKITENVRTIYFKGLETNLKPNDPLVIDFGDGSGAMEFVRVESVTLERDVDRTEVTLQTPTVMEPAAVRAASVEGRGSEKAGFSPLNEYAAAFSSADGLDEADLPALVIKFADDLLKTFTALAEAAPSPDRNEAIKNTLSDLKQLRAILTSPSEVS